MLLRRRLAVLVGPDRDVLGAVVRREIRARGARARPGGARPHRRRPRGLRPRAARSSRTPRARTVDAAIAPSTAGRSNGKRACGSARRTIGSSANASASRSGPRSTGVVTEAPKRGLRPEATWSVPSASRTAQPQAVGPCTSTPFCSAIPPSRIVSIAERVAPASARPRSSARSRELAQRLLELVRRRAALERAAVELDQRHDLADGRRRERLLRGEQRLERVRALLDRVAERRARARAAPRA